MTEATISQEFRQQPVTLAGRTQTVEQWATERGLRLVTVYNRKKTMAWAEALTAGNLQQANRDRLRNSTWNARAKRAGAV